jgi:DNA-binding transcriptional ArsR family regulator
VDRLSLLKVLADPSRQAIYDEIARSGESLSTSEIAERLRLHPNTVRLHLDKMREADLLQVSPDRHGAVGRPQHRWSVNRQVPSLGVEPAGFRLLAHLLAEVAAQPLADPGRVSAVGQRRGWERSTGRPARRLGSSPPELRSECLRALMLELTELGFDPALDFDAQGGNAGPAPPGEPRSPDAAVLETLRATISFTRCPFREVAALYPDLVCELHRGITDGLLTGLAAGQEGWAEARLESFSSLVDADPCRAEVSISA